MLFPVWSTGLTNLQNKEGDATFDGKEHDAEKPDNDVSAAGPIVPIARQNYSNSTNSISAAGPIVPIARQNYSNSTNSISAAGPSNTNTSPTHGKSSLQDASQSPDMLESKDIVYSDHENVGAEADFNNFETSITVSHILTTRIHNAHPISQIIGNLSSTTQTRSMARITRDQGGISQILNEYFHTCMFACFLSQEEPKRVHQALKDPSWIEAMQEELLQFKMQKVWILVDLPHGKRTIGTKWVYMNKKDERGILVRNKARLVAQGHTQKEGIEYEEVFAPVARIEAIRLFLAYASFMGFMVYQMDVKRKSASTPIDTEKPLLKDPEGEDVNVHIYRSMIDSLMYLTSSRLDIMLAQCKKKTVVATSSTEAEYVAGASCYAQVLWIQNQMLDYGLQALVDKKRVVVTEATIREALHLDDAEGVDCLPNEEIFTTLARMGYEKPSTKLTFYKAFFSSRTFNFLKYIFESLVRNVESSSKFYMYPRFIHLIIQNQLGDLSTHSTKYISLALTQKVQPPPPQQSPPPAQPQGAHFPLSLLQEALDACATLARRVEHMEHDKVAQDLEIIKLKSRVKTLERANKGRMLDESDKDEGAELMNEKEEKETEEEEKETEEVRVNLDDAQVEGRQTDIYHIDMDHAIKVLSMQKDEPEIQEAVEVVTTAKLITEVIAAVSETVSAAAVIQTDFPAALVNAAAVMTTASPIKVDVPSTRQRR
nr:hypothetical protein [Tanacetum cinerariifolium]